jgi:uncharacterized protein YutE (UPF0331/DUF86 family)
VVKTQYTNGVIFMKFNGVIERKLSLLADQVIKIKQNISPATFEEFEKEWILIAAAERSVQIAVEIMIDIAERILALENAGPAAYAADAMKKLEMIGAIQSAVVYEKMVKFRNLIVHEYEVIDHRILYEVITEKLDDFIRFQQEIDRYNTKEQ